MEELKQTRAWINLGLSWWNIFQLMFRDIDYDKRKAKAIEDLQNKNR